MISLNLIIIDMLRSSFIKRDEFRKTNCKI